MTSPAALRGGIEENRYAEAEKLRQGIPLRVSRLHTDARREYLEALLDLRNILSINRQAKKMNAMMKIDVVNSLREELDPGSEMNIEDLLMTARDESVGICLGCGTITYGVEPDAHRYQCDECMRHHVYGIEEVVLMGLISFGIHTPQLAA